jgi:type IV pilus assembly protein PilA
MEKRTRGFTLLELMVVVCILAIIAVMAIPSLLNARIAANEASAVSTLRTLATASQQYKVRFTTYAGTLSDLQANGYVDNLVGGGAKAGYNFIYSSTASNFTCNGNPASLGVTGYRYFFVDSSGVIRFSTSGAATTTDSALGQ